MRGFIFSVLIMLFIGCEVSNKTATLNDDSFIAISGGIYYTEKDSFRLDDFEIMSHPITNAQYKVFTDATGYPAPLHWRNGKIPDGKEDYPVIYVNRDDVDTFLVWLNSNSGRNYRLPTSHDFRTAALGGNETGKYYWGNEELKLDTSLINFDPNGDRSFDKWEKYLKPAIWGMQNDFGLYQMAGNIWQLISDELDPEMAAYKFRIETLSSNERYIMGGSWANTREYMNLGRTIHNSPGLRYPDLGFRLVRDPENVNRLNKNRNIAPVMHSSGTVSISWSVLNSDKEDIKFNIYRLTGNNRSHSGFKLNNAPLTTSSYLDSFQINPGTRYQYKVAALDQNDNETDFSEWIGITAAEEQYPVIGKFKPLLVKGGMTPVFGDLEGWGRRGCVIRLDNDNKETSQDPGIPVQLEAFSSTGKSLWRKDIAQHNNIFGSASNAPFNVWDMDGDGKDEVITLLQTGDINNLVILNGMSGNVLYKTPWDLMASDFSRSSTRIQMSIAYLDCKTPAVITQTGIYENEIISAYDNRLNKLWEYKSFMSTSGSGGHKVEVADVDEDGKQEVIYGTTCLNNDGTVRWSIYRQHPDIISIHDYLPDRQGLEVCFIIESSLHAGIYMVDANNGEIIWKNNRVDDPHWSHGHSGWTSDIWEGSPGIECLTNRMGHSDRNFLLFTADGRKIMENFPSGYTPFEWDGDETRELYGLNGQVMGKFDGYDIKIIENIVPNPIPDSRVIFTADLFGDFRSEMVLEAIDSDGRKMILVITASELMEKMYISPAQNLDYRLWLARNRGGGYGSVNNFSLIKPGMNKKSYKF